MSIMQEQKMIDESLLLRYFEKEVSEEEKQKVEEWIRSSEANSRMAKQVAQIFVATRLLHNSKEASPQQALQNFWRQVERRKHKRIWRYIGKVAAILALPVLILTTIYWFSDNSDGNDAIVWMEARGNDSEVCTVLLPDSSTVYLNSQAKLKYPTHFAKERRVYLDGEAYFVVRKQNGKRFIVHTVSEAEVEVLGTEFNVSAYSDIEEFNIALLRGSIELNLPDRSRRYRMTAGEQVFYKKGKYVSAQIGNMDYFKWKEGLLCFNNQPIHVIIDKLRLYYDVRIEVADLPFLEERYSGKFRVKEGIEQVLKVLQLEHKFTYVKDNELNLITIK